MTPHANNGTHPPGHSLPLSSVSYTPPPDQHIFAAAVMIDNNSEFSSLNRSECRQRRFTRSDSRRTENDFVSSASGIGTQDIGRIDTSADTWMLGDHASEMHAMRDDSSTKNRRSRKTRTLEASQKIFTCVVSKNTQSIINEATCASFQS